MDNTILEQLKTYNKNEQIYVGFQPAPLSMMQTSQSDGLAKISKSLKDKYLLIDQVETLLEIIHSSLSAMTIMGINFIPLVGIYCEAKAIGENPSRKIHDELQRQKQEAHENPETKIREEQEKQIAAAAMAEAANG